MCAVADALIAEGRQKGRQEGRQEGRREGRQEGKVEILYELHYSISEIAEKLNLSENRVNEILQK